MPIGIQKRRFPQHTPDIRPPEVFLQDMINYFTQPASQNYGGEPPPPAMAPANAPVADAPVADEEATRQAIMDIRDQAGSPRIGIPINKSAVNIPVPGDPSPEAQYFFNRPPLVPRTMREQVRDYAATLPSPEMVASQIDAEVADRRAKGITSAAPRFAALMRNEAGRGTPLLRTDRPYWAPGMQVAAAPVAPADDPELMARLQAQQEQSLGVMDSKRNFMDAEVENRRKEYMAGTNLADMREKRIGLQKERQAAVTEKAKDRRMTPQQRAAKQFVAGVTAEDGGGVAADLLLGPQYAAAKDRAADNANESRKVDVAERAAAADEARNVAIAEQAKRKQELDEIAAGLRPMPSSSPAFQQQAMKNAAPNMALDPKQLYSQVGPSLDMVDPATLPNAETARQTMGTLGLNEPLLQKLSNYSPNIMGFPTDLPSISGLRNPVAESLLGLLSGGLIGTGTINALSEKPDAYAQRKARQSKAQQLIKLLLNQ